jgi:hypothetical protein
MPPTLSSGPTTAQPGKTAIPARTMIIAAFLKAARAHSFMVTLTSYVVDHPHSPMSG